MMRGVATTLAAVLVGCASPPADESVDMVAAESEIVAAHDAIVAGLIAGTPTTEYHTANWSGVNLNGTPMTLGGFEGEDRVMVYDSIQVVDRDIRFYGESAALRWHGHFYVKVNGEPSYAEMRLLDVYVLEDGRWVNDLTQVTPIFGTVGNPPSN